MLFEHVIVGNTQKSIRLSEMYRNCHDSATSRQYLEGFEDIWTTLSGNQLHRQPLFRWNDRTSASWKFELHRAKNQLCDFLISESRDCFDSNAHEIVAKKLKEAIRLTKSLLIDFNWVFAPDIKNMPELQCEFQLAKLLYIQSLFCQNAFKMSNELKFAKLGYTCIELSNKIWNYGADADLERMFLTNFYYASAKTTEDYGLKVSYAVAAKKLTCDKNIVADCDTWEENNNQIHFQEISTVAPPVRSDVVSVLSRLVSIV